MPQKIQPIPVLDAAAFRRAVRSNGQSLDGAAPGTELGPVGDGGDSGFAKSVAAGVTIYVITRLIDRWFFSPRQAGTQTNRQWPTRAIPLPDRS